MTDTPPGANESSAATADRRAPAAITLVIDYDGADDFLSDYRENLATGTAFIQSSRVLPIGTPVELVLSFPALRVPLTVPAVIRSDGDDLKLGIAVELREGGERAHLAAIAQAVERGDPSVVSRIVQLLLVEDNHHVCSLIRHGLAASVRRRFGMNIAFEVVSADNGGSALELLKTRRFDAMIIDIYLPVVDGAAVIEQARGELGQRELPIIAVSAGGDRTRSAAERAGASAYLEKPIQLRRLLDTMRGLMDLESP